VGGFVYVLDVYLHTYIYIYIYIYIYTYVYIHTHTGAKGGGGLMGGWVGLGGAGQGLLSPAVRLCVRDELVLMSPQVCVCT